MTEQLLAKRYPEVGHYRIALHAANETRRNEIAEMLAASHMVESVYICASRGRGSALPVSHGFDIFIATCGGFDERVIDSLAKESWRRGARVLLIADESKIERLDTMMAIPCNGFVIQNRLTSETLRDALVRVAEGEVPMPALLANRLLSLVRASFAQSRVQGIHLTPRERQVLELLAEGLGNKQIARRLRISSHGVKRHVSHVLTKLNCPNRTLAVAVALTNGILFKQQPACG